MLEQLSWKVGGQQGEGIDSTGNILATSLNRHGYFIYGYRHFSSRIKGGHTNYKIRISTSSRLANADHLDILIAFDQETIDFNSYELRDNGVLIADAKFNPVAPEGKQVRFFPVPLTKIAEENGSAIMKNMVAVGATAAVLGLSPETFLSYLNDKFLRKGEAVVQNNMNALKAGFQYVIDQGIDLSDLNLAPGDGVERLYLTGNDACGFGALAAGVRLMPAYPITPASDIMEYLIKKLPKVGGHVLQTEDEIAAVTMSIGASFGGSRVCTSTSGPGLALMMEGIGLAGITENPIVIFDTQRGGPSTGMPTKHEQSDMYAALWGTHGEIEKIVVAPSNAEECFYMTVDAFNWADHYQVPTIILTDLALSLSDQTVEKFDFSRVTIDRGKLATDEQLAATPQGQLFKRFEFTEDMISPRVFPGKKGGLHHVTGVEHTEVGRPTEDKHIRTKMMNKRLNKFDGVELPNSLSFNGDEDYELLLVGVGSTAGLIDEAMERLQAEGRKIGHLHVKVLNPFPIASVQKYVDRAKKVLVIENNATGQLKNIMRFNGIKGELDSQVKYDGNPYVPSEIYNFVKEMN
ncbi:2-oxoacid:acceptor oxidoreductase subunit alpha [Tumebacillus permanentifrigoris]|uniref:2-oxoglutarate ferredoxin oxidoreductase subunit alpha n=1 Tax=Tumebacillus permanentifrigoris TaxID=378543 RepID=A0A316DBD2_9BACL|nr:2-oxoacid:acceptor oxidoreductase subunit alpha [Tumebacillus permanentifrigoris]PWK11344.1 2-oxoglutarate ferredoxin oxidoreductase subunit alpha [Tumebacillus permanentifrigoris]